MHAFFCSYSNFDLFHFPFFCAWRLLCVKLQKIEMKRVSLKTFFDILRAKQARGEKNRWNNEIEPVITTAHSSSNKLDRMKSTMYAKGELDELKLFRCSVWKYNGKMFDETWAIQLLQSCLAQYMKIDDSCAVCMDSFTINWIWFAKNSLLISIHTHIAFLLSHFQMRKKKWNSLATKNTPLDVQSFK